MSPQLFLHFHCGCAERLDSLDAALDHAKKCHHTVTIAGALAPKYVVGSSSVLCDEQVSSLELCLACGDGFVANSVRKAVEHVVKTNHILHVYGTISEFGSNRKERDSGEHPTDLSLHTCRSQHGGWRGKGVKTAQKNGGKNHV